MSFLSMQERFWGLDYQSQQVLNQLDMHDGRNVDYVDM